MNIGEQWPLLGHAELFSESADAPGGEDLSLFRISADRQVLPQARIDPAQVERLTAGGGDGVEFGERDELDLGETRVPRLVDHLP